MSSTETGLLVFACTFGAALLAMYLRKKLPPDHLDGDSKDVVKLVMGLIATLTALVLGLLISSAHTAYDNQEAEIRQLAVHVFQLDRILVHFGPQGVEARSLLHQLVADDIARTWPAKHAQPAPYAPAQLQAEGEQLFEKIAGLSANTTLEHAGQSRALSLLATIGETRHTMSAQARGSLSWFILGVLVSWVSLLFFGFGLFARLNTTVIMALVAGAVSVATACLLILDMNQPYRGWMQLSSVPLREVLVQMQN
jgi:Protein of unknown function (DUF4239)